MYTHLFQNLDFELIKQGQSAEINLFLTKLRNSIWLLGILFCLIGITDRVLAAAADRFLSGSELIQLVMIGFFCMTWLYLKPEVVSEAVTTEEILQKHGLETVSSQDVPYLQLTQARMLELQQQHIISQEYVLPFPYICQIYHLLNLKHLETIHNFSLNNLRVIHVSQFELTEIGGKVTFQTILDSPLNALRIWRQPIVEVELTLHNPYTVELSIPAYNGKRIIVLFNVLPINDTEHKFLVNIYSDLKWYKPLLQIILHFAACLTLFEDLPYLRKLAERNLQRLVSSTKTSTHETMWLFNRFVDLYGTGKNTFEAMSTVEAH